MANIKTLKISGEPVLVTSSGSVLPIKKAEITISTGTLNLHCNEEYEKITISDNISIACSDKLVDSTGAEIADIGDVIPEYHAMITLSAGKTVTLTGVSHVKASDETDLTITEGTNSTILNKGSSALKLELSIQNGLCFVFVWGG